MLQIRIETGQNVIVRKNLANVGERIAAQLIVCSIMFASVSIVSLISDVYF